MACCEVSMDPDQGWKTSVEEGMRSSARHQWDAVVQGEVNDYNCRLASTPGYVDVDWRIVLAMLWVESAGPSGAEWNRRVMQIGNPGDAGYADLKRPDGAAPVVVRKDLLDRILASQPKDLDDPQLNIKAGIAYLFEKMALTGMKSLPDPHDGGLHDHQVGRGETADAIRREEGTTLDDLAAANPGVKLARLKPGEVLHFHKAHMGRAILGWQVFTPEVIAAQYNHKDTKKYARRLRYALDRINADTPAGGGLGRSCTGGDATDHYSGGGVGGGGGGPW